ITLRQFAQSDVKFVSHAVVSPDIARLAGLHPGCGDDDLLAFISKQVDRFATGTGASFVIVADASGEPVGQVGIFLDYDERASMGYWVIASARGHGFAAAGLRAAADYAFESFKVERLELYIEPENAASLR